MRAINPIRSPKSLALLTLLSLPFVGTAQADGGASASASCTVDWSAATFSSSPTASGGPNPYAELAQAYGYYLPTNQFSFNEAKAPGWTPISATENFAPGTSATASVNNAELSSSATNAGDFQNNAQIEKTGFVKTKNGTVTIAVPYSLNIAITNSSTGLCCYSATDQAIIELFNAAGNTLEGTASADATDSYGAIEDYTKNGILTLTVHGLPAGMYWFDVLADSQTAFVPEPAALLMLSAGLLSLAALSFRKRLA
ncbi:MAG: PEP-CTERM sorting domain-containing protein [Candidatus Acidiferrales bacterium]